MHKINTPELRFPVTIAGQEFVVDFGLMHPTWVEVHLRKAAQRYVNDSLTAMAGELPSVKAAAAALAFGEIHSGEAKAEKPRKAASISKADPVTALARDLATTDLTAMLNKNKHVFGQDEKTWAAHSATAKYFKVSEKGRVTFNMAAMDEYIAKAVTRKNDPVDFVAIAQERVNSAETIADDVDLSDFGL